MALEPGYFIAEQYALQRIHGQNAYTTKNDAVMRANVDMSVVSGLRGKVPAMRHICNRWYADGIARKWAAGLTIGAICRDSRDYLTEMSFAERCEIMARVAYKTARKQAHVLSRTTR